MKIQQHTAIRVIKHVKANYYTQELLFRDVYARVVKQLLLGATKNISKDIKAYFSWTQLRENAMIAYNLDRFEAPILKDFKANKEAFYNDLKKELGQDVALAVCVELNSLL